MNKSYLSIAFLLTIISLVLPIKVLADTSCQPIYGGGQSCVTTNNIVVDKTILNPQTNKFVDNLGINDVKYQPGFITTFQISITNTGTNTISKIDVKDIFPQFISFSSGAGTFDANTNTLSFNLVNLAPNETRKFSIMGRVFNADKLPSTTGSVVCVVNQAIAMIDNSNVAQDNAQFCIQKTVATTKGGFPVVSPVLATSTPKTGAEMLGLLALIPTGLAGFALRKYSNKKGIEK